MRPVFRASPAFVALLLVTVAQASEPGRPLIADDIIGIHEVGDPQLSPDGEWVAHTVRTSDLATDRRTTHVWMSRWDGKHTVQLTHSRESEHTPRFSPDGRYLSFLSARGGENDPDQLWLMDRAGGEARAITSFKGDVLDHEWSPDGTRIALIVMDADPARLAGAQDRTPPPIVIDRYWFKKDEAGYLGALRQHLYVLDVRTGKAEVLTPGAFDEMLPAWSPDGSRIAFLSKRTGDPDRNSDHGLYVVAATPGSELRLLTTFPGDAGDAGRTAAPAWRPDGREIAVTAARDARLMYYSRQHLLIVPVAGGEPRILTADVDRNMLSPRWAADGKWIYALLEDDRNQHLVRLHAASGRLERLQEGRREATAFDVGDRNRIVLLESTVDRPDEVFALEAGKARQLTHHNDAWLSTLKLAPVQEISYASKDGTQINGFLVTPPEYTPGQKHPTVLQIHGGPVSQYANSFMPLWQILASQGYVVVGANPRGSSGRGEVFATAIWAEWGGKDTEDVLGAVDYAVKSGIADPERLGVGGWSYGGILTNVVIAKDPRFKAATSGASQGNALAGYGTDMYVREYELELGTPWKNPDAYLRNAYPLLHADRIRTPTLFLAGAKDFNMPLLNSEQMYQALRSTGVDTQLIIYPDQFHGLGKPSYLIDRMQRYIGWYARYLK